MKVGLQVVVDDIAESMKGVADEVLRVCLKIQLWRWRGIWHARCVLKRMLPMFGSSNAKGRLDVYFLSM